MYSSALALLLLFVPLPYPFVPIQFTLIGLVASGIPGVVLAFGAKLQARAETFHEHRAQTRLGRRFYDFCGGGLSPLPRRAVRAQL